MEGIDEISTTINNFFCGECDFCHGKQENAMEKDVTPQLYFVLS